MDNNAILINIKIDYRKKDGTNEICSFELYVNRYITLKQLTDGIQKSVRNSDKICPNSDLEAVAGVINNLDEGKTWLYLQQYDGSQKKLLERANDPDVLESSLSSLGFMTSSTLLYTSDYKAEKEPDFSLPVTAFSEDNKIVYPDYNISTRQIRLPDTTPIDIISPSEPPSRRQKQLIATLFPPLISMMVMFAVRGLLTGGNGLSRALVSCAMGLATMIIAVFTYRRQRKEYIQEEIDWRTHYQSYINKKIQEIKKRRINETDLLNEEYPEVSELVSYGEQASGASIYKLDGKRIYYRSSKDDDFLVVRLGTSSSVRASFEIKGEKKQVVYTDVSFILDDASDTINIYESDKGENRLFDLPGILAEKYRNLQDAPLLYSLRNKQTVGIVDEGEGGKLVHAHRFIEKLLFELCCFHTPEELQIVVLFEKTNDEDAIEHAISLFRFFPHFRGLFEKCSQFVFDENSAGIAYNHLNSLMDARSAEESECLPHILVVIFDDYDIMEHSFASYFPGSRKERGATGTTRGLTFLCAAEHREYLPSYCDDVINLNWSAANPTDACLHPHVEAVQDASVDFSVQELHNPQKDGSSMPSEVCDMERAMRFISSIWLPKIAEGARIPAAVGMFDILPPTALGNNPEKSEGILKRWIHGRWDSNRQRSKLKTLSVPMGKDELGNIFSLDLHEKADGPHMIVAGTTGSGKTETIISYLLALCLFYRPDEVNLLLVDMKGGGFVKRLGDLPHVVGNITDVTGDENGSGAEYMLRRFLSSIKAEIRRRKKMFNLFKVDNIDDYMVALKALTDRNIPIDDEARIAHLFVIIDEFTELKRYSSEHSDVDYMGEVTTIARIGRSLGVHIILISQNIEGAITEDIRVNVKSRLCLKVATRQASKEMIGNDLAARPTMPGNGRAYLLVGTGSRFVYFQSAYSGFGIDVNTDKKDSEIILASRSGAYSTFAELHTGRQASRTQLQAIVSSVKEAYNTEIASMRVVPPHIVFTNPIPEKIIYDGEKGFTDVATSKTDKYVAFWQREKDGSDERSVTELQSPSQPSEYQIAVGVKDLPEEGKQNTAFINPLKNNIIVFGEAMSGKTTFIKNYLVQVDWMQRTRREAEQQAKRAYPKNQEAINRIPEEEIYIIDFGGNLGKYAVLYPVCACFDGTNEENIKRLFRTLDGRIKENAAQLNSDSYLSVYENTPEKCPAHMTLIVDNTNAFAANDRYSTYLDKIIAYSRDGLSKGLSVILTANNTSGLSKLISNCALKIAFSMPAESYLEIFGLRVDNTLQKKPGRGYAVFDSVIWEYQGFLPFGNEKEELQKYLENHEIMMNPRKLAAFPNEPLTFRNLNDHMLVPKEGGLAAESVIVGLDYYTHHPVGLDPDMYRGIAITGKRGFGKTNMLKLLVEGIIRKMAPRGDLRFVCLDDGRRGLQDRELMNLLSAKKPDEETTGHEISSVWFTSLKEFNLYTYSTGYGGSVLKTQKEKSIAVRWSSDNPSVATVDAETGDVTAVSPGEAIISAVTGNGESEKKTNFTIKVKGAELVKDSEKEMAVGDTQRLNALNTRPNSVGRPGEGSGLPTPILNGAVKQTPFTVFILQDQSIYSPTRSPEANILKNWIQRSMPEAIERGYLFIFSDVGRISREYADDFNTMFSWHLILENIEDFAVRSGGKNPIGERAEVKELKAEYAPCDLGDGYSYDVEGDELHKIRFIKYERKEENQDE